MNKDIRLYDLLEIENDPAILELKCPETGMLLWPFVRSTFLRMIKSDLHYQDQPLINEERKRKFYSELYRITKTSYFNYFKSSAGKADVLITTTGASTFKSNGIYKDRLSDYFVEVFDKSIVLEDLKYWNWTFPRKNMKLIFHDPLKVITSTRARFNSYIKPTETHEIQKFVNLIKYRSEELIGWEMSDQKVRFLVSLLCHVSGVIPLRYKAYQKFLRKRGIKVLVGKMLCYGFFNDLVKAAKDIGIVVAEYQHGMVTKGHDAYNVAPVLLKSKEYRNTLPDHFLGYGQWWNNQSNIPCKKHEIGSPHRSEQLKLLKRKKEDSTKKILILGDGRETNTYLDLAALLSVSLRGEARIIFRPHPHERKQFSGKSKISGYPNIQIDQNSDIYESFQSSDTVISELSTGLFEAVGMVDRIFAWSTAKSRFALPEHPFGTFESSEELTEKLKNNQAGYINSQQTEEIWKSSWRENYLNFLTGEGGIGF